MDHKATIDVLYKRLNLLSLSGIEPRFERCSLVVYVVMLTLSDILHLGNKFMCVLTMCLCVQRRAGSLLPVQKQISFYLR